MGYLEQLKQHRQSAGTAPEAREFNERNEKTLIRESKPLPVASGQSNEINEINEETLCTITGCARAARPIELGARAIVRLCRTHRRELYRRARAISDRLNPGSHPEFEPRLCALCGSPENPADGCSWCRNSPLVAMAQ